MFKYVKKNIISQVVLLVLFLQGLVVFSQDILQPVPEFGAFACVTQGDSQRKIIFTYENGIFDVNNTFSVLLSDSTGNFADAVNIVNVTGQNFFPFTDIEASFSIPEDAYGDCYRVRIVADMGTPNDPNDDISSPDSDCFGMYFMTSQQLILEYEGERDVVLCNGNPVTVTLNEIDPTFTYRWYRDNVQIMGESGLSLTINQPGEYYAQINYGQCPGGNSNVVTVTSLDTDNVTIQGDDVVSICANETYDLVASIDDTSLIYNWYKDDVLIDGLDAYTPVYTTPLSNQFGVYYVEIIDGNCSTRSQDVTVQPRDDLQFNPEVIDVNQGVASPRLRLPTETVLLGVEHEASSPTYQWYYNGDPRPASTGDQINASLEGSYFIVVTDNSTACPVSNTSEEYIIVDAVSLAPTIREASDYVDCGVDSTTLSILGISAIGTDGNEYDLSSSQIDELDFQWYKDGVAISGATTSELNIESYEDNATYYLNVSVSSLSGDSNEIDVLLTLVDVEINSSSTSNAICPGDVINLSIDNVAGFTYTWFKDGIEMTVTDTSSVDVDEVGVYSVTFEGFGCLNSVAEVNIVEFDDTVLEVTPSTTAILTPGETVLLEATGADAYEWYNEDGTLLSTTESLEVIEIGVYTLIGTVGGCQAEREINVVEDDGLFIIPNVLTPFNGDGINDTWELPNRFAFQTNVQVVIYNSKGEEILNTTDYQNNWPEDNNLRDGMLFYFKVIKDDALVKAGTISVLQ